MSYRKLLKMPDWTGWDHHRSGWKYVLQGMRTLHSDDGVLFDGYLDQYFNNKSFDSPWCGFFHNAPFHPSFSTNDKYKFGRELDYVLDTDNFKRSYPFCKALFTVSKYVARWLTTRVSVPVCSFVHPTDEPDVYFSYQSFLDNPEKKLILTGQWMRKYETLFYINTKYKKCILDCDDPMQKWEKTKEIVGEERYSTVSFLSRVSDAGYDLLLERNIVFLDLFDVAACNGIIDCIIRNTPVLTRRFPGNVEYLGDKYPFYFSDINEAQCKLADEKLILETTKYLENLPIKKKMTIESFLNSMVNCHAYKSLNPRKLF